MERLKHRVREGWSSLGLVARLRWGAIGAVGYAAVLVLSRNLVPRAPRNP
jgi:hypothetical protein